MRRIAIAFVAFVAVASMVAADKPKAPRDFRSRLAELERRFADLEDRFEAVEDRLKAVEGHQFAADGEEEKPRPLRPKDVMALVPDKLRPAMADDARLNSPLRTELDEWIDENLVGRRMVLTGRIRDMVPVAGNVFAMGITVPGPTGLPGLHGGTWINCRFPALLVGKASTMQEGDTVRVFGTIESVSFSADGYSAELIDGSF